MGGKRASTGDITITLSIATLFMTLVTLNPTRDPQPYKIVGYDPSP